MNKKTNDDLVKLTLKRLEKKKIDVATAAVILGVTERQIYRLRKPKQIKAKPIKKPPINKTDQSLEEKIVNLYLTKYKGFSHVHFQEKLESEEKINVTLKTLTRILKRHYIISPFATKKTKKEMKKILQSINQVTKPDNEQNLYENNNIIEDAKEIHNRVHHIEDYGELLQLDARQDFYIDEEKWTLHLAIDVASGIFVGAYFDKEETLNGYQHVLYQIIKDYGIPKCILTDNRTVFEFLNKNSKEESKNTLIQFRYSCIQLGIKLQTTSVATYKSIIERANGTFGRRVPQEMRLLGIKDLITANAFLKNYLNEMNNKFSHGYRGNNVFKTAPEEETLCNMIGIVARRVFDKSCCIRFNKKYYLATVHDKIVAFMGGVKCLVIKTFDNRLIIVVDSIAYKAISIEDYEYDPEKQSNPEGREFLISHRVNPTELYNYKRKHISTWNYESFQRYVDRELDYINNKY